MAMVNMNNYEEYILLHADGELNEAETKDLLAFIARHPELQGELDMYMDTKLMPDTTVVYEYKEQLLKKETKTIVLGNKWIYSATAACAALVLVFIFMNKNNDNGQTTIAGNTTQPVDTVPAVVQHKEELHSTPVNPIVATPEQQEKKQPATYVATTIKTKTTKAPQLVQVKKQEEVIVKQQSPTQHIEAPIVKEQRLPKQEQTMPRVIVRQEETIPLVPEETNAKEHKGLLALLPEKERFDGVREIGDELGSKLKKVKHIKEDLQQTEAVSFRIGRKQLFSIQL
jgi:co-chaperonin GroES (HSP10)